VQRPQTIRPLGMAGRRQMRKESGMME
jgi:hypothetical protein